LITIIFASLAAAIYSQAGEVSGYVRDQNGSTVAGARVTFTVTGVTPLSTVTDEDGFFRFENNSSSSGRITVIARGFQTYTSEWSGSELTATLIPTAVSEQVTVTRSEARLSDTPQSVVVLDVRELRSNPAVTLDDKLRQVPGFTLFRRTGSQTANPTSQGVSLRGTGGSGASRAAVTVDGFPLNDPFGGWVYWGRVPVEAVNDVEVLRGSAGEVSGSSAIGGVISVTTRDAATASVFDLDASYGSQNTSLASLYAASGFRDVDASLAAENFRTDGFISVAEGQRGLVDTLSGSRRSSFLPQVDYRFRKSDRVFASGEYFQDRRANGTPLQTNDTKIYSLRSGLDLSSRSLGDLILRGWLGSQIYHQSFSSIAADRNSESLTRLQIVPSSSAGANLQWSKAFTRRGSIYGGSEFRIVRGSSDETAFTAGRATSFVNAGGREATIGAFVGGSYLPTEKFVLSGGVRIDHWQEYSAYSDTRPLNRALFADRNETAVSPRLSALFRINPAVAITGNFSKGFRQPTLNELYRSFRVGNVLTTANANLRAEHSTTGEGGVLVSEFADRLYVRAVAFCTVIDQPVSNVTLSTTPVLITRQRQNLGQTRSCGLEADSQFRATHDLNFSAGYLFVDARVTKFPADRSLEGLRVPQVAKNQFTLQARYDNARLANVALQLRASGQQFDDDQNIFRLAGFATVDVFASRWIDRRLEIYVAAENIFNEKVESGRTPVLTLASPRTVRVGIRLNFSRPR
jgi:outer membrane receptor protein involved in Fe transport